MTYVSSLFTLKESDIGQFNPTLLGKKMNCES